MLSDKCPENKVFNHIVSATLAETIQPPVRRQGRALTLPVAIIGEMPLKAAIYYMQISVKNDVLRVVEGDHAQFTYPVNYRFKDKTKRF